jgi:2-amino-4-hydroxy-6-hydroxymethyldihydropteridine diphosphokinase
VEVPARHDESVLIGLGANLGDPLATLRSARLELEELGTVLAASSLYRTEPVGGPPGQLPYLNAVVSLRPYRELASPERLLQALLQLETRHGRQRRIRWAARTLDLDLLTFGERTSSSERLELPHPRMLERPFVLVPLLEIAPHWRHPLSGVTAAGALAGLDTTGVQMLPDSWQAAGSGSGGRS